MTLPTLLHSTTLYEITAYLSITDIRSDFRNERYAEEELNVMQANAYHYEMLHRGWYKGYQHIALK
jgi:hypothetical protein